MIKEDTQIDQSILTRFMIFNKKGRLAHAYLFIGPADAGKAETALAVAKLLNCQENLDRKKESFCNRCLSCKRINSGNHPDVHILQNDGPIKIEKIRELLGQVKLKPFSSERKVFLIKNIENLTTPAGNALLKTLEEPSATSLLLLTTSVAENNLETIKSRCHAVYFSSSSKTKLADRLAEYYDENPSDCHFLAYFSEGCMQKAKKMKEKGILKTKNEIINNFILSQADEKYTKKVLSEKDLMKLFLSVLLSWVRDGLLLKAGAGKINIINIDRLDELNQFQEKYSFQALEQLNDEIINMSKLLAENLNIKIPLMIIREKFAHGENGAG